MTTTNDSNGDPMSPDDAVAVFETLLHTPLRENTWGQKWQVDWLDVQRALNVVKTNDVTLLSNKLVQTKRCNLLLFLLLQGAPLNVVEKIKQLWQDINFSGHG